MIALARVPEHFTFRATCSLWPSVYRLLDEFMVML